MAPANQLETPGPFALRSSMENLWRSENERSSPAPAATSGALPARVARQSQFQGEQQILCMCGHPSASTFRRTQTECADLRAKVVPSEVFRLRLESPSLQGSLGPRIPQLRDFRQRQHLPQGRLPKRYASSRARSSPENRRAFRSQPGRAQPCRKNPPPRVLAHPQHAAKSPTHSREARHRRSLPEKGTAIARRRLGTLLPALSSFRFRRPGPWLGDWWQILLSAALRPRGSQLLFLEGPAQGERLPARENLERIDMRKPTCVP